MLPGYDPETDSNYDEEEFRLYVDDDDYDSVADEIEAFLDANEYDTHLGGTHE